MSLRIWIILMVICILAVPIIIAIKLWKLSSRANVEKKIRGDAEFADFVQKYCQNIVKKPLGKFTRSEILAMMSYYKQICNKEVEHDRNLCV